MLRLFIDFCLPCAIAVQFHCDACDTEIERETSAIDTVARLAELQARYSYSLDMVDYSMG